MTDERLDQILKQALSPDIDVSEIRIKRKANKMNIKKALALGLAACAALLFVVVSAFFILGGPLPKTPSDVTTGTEGSVGSEGSDESGLSESTTLESIVIKDNFFAISANAAGMYDDVSSGAFIGLSGKEAQTGDLAHLALRFYISGANIERVKISTDKCNIYCVTPATYEEYESNLTNGDLNDCYVNTGSDYPEQYEHWIIPGQTYEGAYNEDMAFGMSVPMELWSDNEDPKERFYETTYLVDGATITIEVTFADESVETHHYKVIVGRVYIPDDDSEPITRFIEYEGESNTMGYLLSQID